MRDEAADRSPDEPRLSSQIKVDATVRVGDADREQAGSLLGQAFTLGYLSLQEYEVRLDQALQARTGGDVRGLLADLPADLVNDHGPGRRPTWGTTVLQGVRIYLAAYLLGALILAGVWFATEITVGDWYFWHAWPILGACISVASVSDTSHGV